MGFLKKMKSMSGGVSKDLLQNGLLARGVIVGVEGTRVSTGHDHDPHPVVIFTVEVTLDGQDPYQATCRQAVPLAAVPQFVPGQTMVAVRVNPNDRNEIALDLATPPPTVTAKPSEGPRASDILRTGDPAKAVIVQTQPLGMKNPEGVDLHAFVLTVIRDGQTPYQVQVGNPVPEAAVPLLYPGSELPAKIQSDNPEGVVIDFEAALAQYESGSG